MTDVEFYNEYLTSELGLVRPEIFLSALHSALEDSDYAEFRASLAVEYDRKGTQTRSDVDVESAYRSPSNDTIVLVLEISLPEYSLTPAMADLVSASQDGIRNSRIAALEKRKAAALVELDAVEREVGSLNREGGNFQ